ncbi:MAG TPA: uroporphyrinogen-III synthase [Anaeromyxobacteraceae bacterium]|nr:uroporphyrinogen-III synthase [Anaeromyxobacteraceae bacterium]
MVAVPKGPLSLRGRRVAVTRARPEGEDPLGERLAALGAEVLETPAIALADPTSFEELDAALRGLERFDLLVFASANAVERTFARARRLGIPGSALLRPRLAAVGAATAARLARAGRPPDLVPREARGEALAEALSPEVRGRAVLVPRAEEGRPELLAGLARAGARLVAPAAYRTVEAPPEQLEPLRAALAAGALDAVTFASPSAVRAVLALPGVEATLRAGVVVAAIGPTTRSELARYGLSPAVVPGEASARALADALAERLGPGPGE